MRSCGIFATSQKAFSWIRNLELNAATAALTIAVTLENGSGTDATATVSYARALITKVSPPSIDASGDRKATYDVTFRPDGSVGT
jgi:hypothetical protein